MLCVLVRKEWVEWLNLVDRWEETEDGLLGRHHGKLHWRIRGSDCKFRHLVTTIRGSCRVHFCVHRLFDAYLVWIKLMDGFIVDFV
jgi:hypothetical protein